MHKKYMHNVCMIRCASDITLEGQNMYVKTDFCCEDLIIENDSLKPKKLFSNDLYIKVKE